MNEIKLWAQCVFGTFVTFGRRSDTTLMNRSFYSIFKPHHVWDKRKLHGLEIALMIIFTVAETSSFVGMTKGFAAAEDISDRCAIRSRGAPSSSYFFFQAQLIYLPFCISKLGRAVLNTMWRNLKKCLVLIIWELNYRTNATLVLHLQNIFIVQEQHISTY